jgi:Tol biopolymer transport system component
MTTFSRFVPIVVTTTFGILTGLTSCSTGDDDDGGGTSSTLPLATPVAAVALDEDTASGPITLTGTSPLGAVPLVVEVRVPPLNGVLDAVSGAAPFQVVFTPDRDFNGADGFVFVVSDPNGGESVPTLVNLTVRPVNDAPTLTDIGALVAGIGLPFSATPMAGDVDLGDVLTFSLAGTLPGWASFDPATGTVGGTPAPADLGTTAGLVVSVDDGSGDPPVAAPAFDLTVVPNPPVRLEFGASPPANVNAGDPWTPFTAVLLDANDNVLPIPGVLVHVELTMGTGQLLGTTTRATNGSGVATFDDLAYDVAEAIAFDVDATGFNGISGSALTVGPALPLRLAFGVPPAAVELEEVVFGAFTVEVRDVLGNVVQSDNTTEITLGVSTGTGTLGGTRTRTVAGGVAVFGDLTYSRPETLVLEARSTPTLLAALSGPITVEGGLPGGLEIELTSRGSGTAGNGSSGGTAVSADGRFSVFQSNATDLVPGDTNGATDVFRLDRVTGATTRLSVSTGGVQGNGPSVAPAVSANGSRVVFASVASTLVAGDTNGASDIFLHDRGTGATTRISVDSAGAQASGGSFAPSISADGRFVVFESDAANLVPGDGNGLRDVFLRDLIAGTIVRVSEGGGGADALGASSRGTIAADGGAVTFQSLAPNLVAGDTNGVADVFHRALSTGVVTRVSVDSSGAQGDGASTVPSPSREGRFVVFASVATNLVAPGNTAKHVYVHDIVLGKTMRASIDDEGAPGNGDSDLPSISCDGRYVAFVSSATNLVALDGNGVADVFVRDRIAEQTYRVNVDRRGSEANAASGAPLFSCDGRYVTFPSDADNLVQADTNGTTDAFVAPNALSGGGFPPPGFEIVRVSVDEEGLEGDHHSHSISISGNGRFGAFASQASNLVPNDTNGQLDVFVKDAVTDRIALITRAFDGGPSSGASTAPAISAEGRFVAFESLAPDLVPGDTNGERDVFLFDRLTGEMERISVRSDGGEIAGPSFGPSLSDNGRFVTFKTFIDGVVAGDTNGLWDVFVHDRALHRIEHVSVPSAGGFPDGDSTFPSLSSDGNFVAFMSDATNLVPGDLNGERDIFVRDRSAATTVRVSVAAGGGDSNDESQAPSIAKDGLRVAFVSAATNLVANDTNGFFDVFLYDRLTGSTQRLSVSTTGLEGNGASVFPAISRDGTVVAFMSFATNLVAGDTNAKGDVFVRKASAVTTRVSVDALGGEADGLSRQPAISTDGSLVSFESQATNLVTDDTNGRLDVFTAPVP